MKEFTRETLNEKTNDELKEICKKQGIVGVSKKRKNEIIDILLFRESDSKGVKSVEKAKSTEDPNTINAISFSITSVLTKPSAKKGDKTTSTIRVSSGASCGDFPVTGKTIAAVKALLEEVLNIPKMSQALVNGKVAQDSHVIAESEEIEFIKPGGEKGLK